MQRMKLEAPASRIHWSKDTKRKLARETAKTLIAWDVWTPIRDQDVMRAVRAIQPIVLASDLHRDIPGPSRVPWLREMVEQEIREIREKQSTPEPSHPNAINITAPLQIEVDPSTILPIPLPDRDDVGLILDALTEIDTKLNKCLAAQSMHETAIGSMSATINSLGRELEGLRAAVLRRRARVAAKALASPAFEVPEKPNPHPNPLRIIVAGIERGSQETLIANATKGFGPLIKLQFANTHQSPAHLPHFDQIVLTKFTTKIWLNKAEHLYRGRNHKVHGIKEAIDLILKFASNPEKYRAN